MRSLLRRRCRRCQKVHECAEHRRICKVCDAKRVALWAKNNKEKINSRQAIWRAKNPLKHLEYRLRGSEYRFSEKEIERILTWKTGTRCRVCGKRMKKIGKGWNDGCIDHNHKTGKFRGIICSRCNWVLGILEESIKLINALKRYLKGRK